MALVLALFSHDAGAQGALPRTVADVLARVEAAGEPPGAPAAREVLVQPVPPNARGDALLEFHLARAAAAAELGHPELLLAERRRIVELTEGERNQPKHLLDLAIVELTAGNWADAQALTLRAARASTAYHGQDVAATALLARMQSWLGDVSNARTATDRVEAQFSRARLYSGAEPYVELVGALIMWAKADTLLADGKTAQAESALRAAVEHALADTKIAASRARSIERAPAPDATWHLLDLMEAQLARLLALQGRAAGAEAAARSMLDRNIERYGRTSASTAVALATLGEVLAGQGRWKEAGRTADLAARILDASGTSPASAYAFAVRKARIDALIGEGRWNSAGAAIDELRAQLTAAGSLLAATERQGAWAVAMIRTRNPGAAAAWMSRLYAEQKRVLGAERYETAESLGLWAAALAATGQKAEALEAFAAAVPILVAPTHAAGDTENAMRHLKRRAILLAYIGLLHDLQGDALVAAKGIDAAGEALRIGDALRGGAVQSALAASAARAMAGTPKLGELIRREQDAKRELGLLDDRMNALSLAPESRERAEAIARARERAKELEGERSELLRAIESRFPDYADLVSPRPARVEQARKALRPGEALISMVSGEDRTFVWALGPDNRFAFRASTLGAPEIEAIVARLRTALDPERMDFEALGHLDLRSAHLLYQDLLLPVAPVWQAAADLTVVTDGALARLPLSLLPIEMPPPAAGEGVPFVEMKKVAFLARKASVTNVPSINAFVRLRALPPGARERAPLIGFGDPQFGPESVADAGATRGARLRGVLRRGEDYAAYSRLAPLPDTRLELQSIAKALGADAERDLYFGAAASREMVLSIDLSRRRIVAFATHGLVAGDLPGLTQPALALSLPRSPDDSPLLTLQDVLGLRLDADLVVLSACNTAAGEGQGAEAVSGLGRGFFYAGSRTLLATHWPVETESARLLVSELFARYAADPALTRAQALRRAMLTLIDGPGRVDAQGRTEFSYAHPLFWAAYALYGDGGR